MFFALSKIFWFLAAPANLLLIALIAAACLSFTRWRRWSDRIIRVCAVCALILAVVPVGVFMRAHLENRFPANPELPDHVHGIVILGGVIAPRLSKERGAAQINSAVERITAGAALAKQFPGAKVIFSGGSGDLFDPDQREAHFAPAIFSQLGLTEGRVLYEDRARNTAENARYAMDLGKPTQGENWILVTSAFHMPRSVGTFRKAGWTAIIPYPVDFDTEPNPRLNLSFDLLSGIGSFSSGLHEAIGLTAYWLAGRTNAWYPAPEK